MIFPIPKVGYVGSLEGIDGWAVRMRMVSNGFFPGRLEKEPSA